MLNREGGVGESSHRLGRFSASSSDLLTGGRIIYSARLAVLAKWKLPPGRSRRLRVTAAADRPRAWTERACIGRCDVC